MKLIERCSGRGFDSRQVHQKYIGFGKQQCVAFTGSLE